MIAAPVVVQVEDRRLEGFKAAQHAEEVGDATRHAARQALEDVGVEPGARHVDEMAAAFARRRERKFEAPDVWSAVRQAATQRAVPAGSRVCSGACPVIARAERRRPEAYVGGSDIVLAHDAVSASCSTPSPPTARMRRNPGEGSRHQ